MRAMLIGGPVAAAVIDDEVLVSLGDLLTLVSRAEMDYRDADAIDHAEAMRTMYRAFDEYRTLVERRLTCR